MESLKSIFLALAVGILFVPLAMSVKKFATYDTAINFSVTFDPVTCYGCKDCPCKYTLNNGDSYILSSFDKRHCTTDHEKINEGIKNNMESITIDLKVKEYRKFFDCLKWYSAHPTLGAKK